MSSIGGTAVAIPPDQRESVARRFWSKVVGRGGSGCWIWVGARLPDGYGSFGLGSRRDRSARIFRAHRVAYALEVGPVPAGVVVAHRCDNPACVRPEHLFLTTQAGNMQDAAAKGRMSHPGARNANAKFTAGEVRRIRAAVASGRKTQAQLAREHGVVESCIGNMVHGRSYAEVG